MCVCVSGCLEERGQGVAEPKRNIQREKPVILSVFMQACVYDPTVNQSMLGAILCLLSCRVPHADTAWLMWLPWVGDSACNQAPACNHPPFLFICSFTEGQSCCQTCKLQHWGGRGWYEGKGGSGAAPQESLEVSPPYNAKNDTSLAGARGPDCQLQQIVGHCSWQNVTPSTLQTKQDPPLKGMLPNVPWCTCAGAGRDKWPFTSH